MSRLRAFKLVSIPADIYRTPEEMEAAGDALFTYFADPDNRKKPKVKAGKFDVEGQPLDSLSWTRYLGADALVLTVVDRRPTKTGGFGLVAVQATVESNIVIGEVDVFGMTTQVSGIRRVFEGPIVDEYFNSVDLRGQLFSQLGERSHRPNGEDEIMTLAKALASVNLPLQQPQKALM